MPKSRCSTLLSFILGFTSTAILLVACTGTPRNTTLSVPSSAHTDIPETGEPILKMTPEISSTIPINQAPGVPATEMPKQAAQEHPSQAVVSSPTLITPERVTTFPDPQNYTWQVFADGFEKPVGLVSPMDGSGRLFFLEQQGLVHILLNGERLSIPYLDLRDRTSTRGGVSRGLFGMAFHPDYPQTPYFYIHYSDIDGLSVIARFQVSEDPNLADPSSELQLLKIEFPIGEHRGGDLAFGADGYLYISIGDGGAAGNGDADGNAQNQNTLLGKILRLDVDQGDPYRIPGDNPFVNGGGRGEVWAYGLRNPWRFAFDRLNGDLFIADVGENQQEEINYLPGYAPGGSNFGWNYLEGNLPFRGKPPGSLTLVNPVMQYDHSQGCSVTGGVVYRGKALPEWFGVYLYGDYCQGNVWGLLRKPNQDWENILVEKVPAYITAFGQDEAGEVYLVDISGEIFRFVRK